MPKQNKMIMAERHALKLQHQLRTIPVNSYKKLNQAQMRFLLNKMHTILPPLFSTMSNSKRTWRNSEWKWTVSSSSPSTDWSPSRSFTFSSTRVVKIILSEDINDLYVYYLRQTLRNYEYVNTLNQKTNMHSLFYHH